MLSTLFSRPHQARFIAFIAAMLIFVAMLKLGLIVVLYAGMLTYALVMKLSAHRISRGARSQHSRWFAVVLVAVVVGAALVLSGFSLQLMLRSGLDVKQLVLQMGDILESARSWLPTLLSERLPQQDDLLANA